MSVQIVSGVGAPRAMGSANGGKLYSFNALDAVTAQTVAPANPSRTQIVFHNPGAVDVLVFPSLKMSSVAVPSDTANAPTVAAPGGAFRIYANGGSLTVEGENSTAWKAFAASGITGTLTVMDSNA